ncbi:aminotransferase class V-fold PLP-dependent enzyme [Patescibacteria group bacterium]|nr:aminotransferase class V-fold PLP-dependent enzyme [Patescibacteria group bacterium]
MKRIYLDSASAAIPSKKAVAAYTRAARIFGNPSSPHEEGRKARSILEEARRVVAAEVGAKPEAILFTAGATEANGIAIRGHVKALLKEGKKPSDIHLLYLPSAHASTVEAMEALKSEGIDVEPLVLRDGGIDLNAVKKQLKDTTALVVVEAVCGETGTRFDTRGLRQVIGSSVRMLVDASQAPLVESVERTRLAADMITLDAAKIGGVRGVGVLVAPVSVPLLPVIEGGGQERDIRSGTQTPALAASFAAAMVEAHANRDAFRTRTEKMREKFLARIEGAVVNGKNQAPHIINLSFPGVDTEYLSALLDEGGIAVATRSACETDSGKSRAVFALTGDEARARSTLRISLGVATTERDLMMLQKALVRNLAFLSVSSRAE